MNDDLRHLSMLELFRVETENQIAVLTSGLLELDKVSGPDTPHLTPRTSPLAPGASVAPLLESLMRAAHSLKGAARIVNLAVAVRVAHAMEDCFVAAQGGKIELNQPVVDALFRGVDLFTHISKRDEVNIASWETDHATEIQEFLQSLAALMPPQSGTSVLSEPAKPAPPRGGSPAPAENGESSPAPSSPPGQRSETPGIATSQLETLPTGGKEQPSSLHPVSLPSPQADRVLRLTAENLNRLLGLAGESLVESRWLRPFTDSLQRLKRMHSDLEARLAGLREGLRNDPDLSAKGPGCESLAGALDTVLGQVADNRQFLAERLRELDGFDQRSAHLSNRLYLEVLRTRMRPFADGTQRFPRMVRDLARSLGKQARLEISGQNTPVDRDILELLETPLAHLLRNAVDHGCESPDQRLRAGKPAEALIQIEARHVAGMLQVVVADDGAGVDPQRLREIVVRRKLTAPALVEKMSETELLEFLFLPGFTFKDKVTEISGRGVGLDVVQNMVKSVRGTVRVFTQPGRGMKFQLQLPLTLSVLRALLVEVGGEPYAIPLARIIRTLKLPREKVETLEGRHHFKFGEQPIGLLTAHEMLECGEPKASTNGLSIVVLGERSTRYGLLVDGFLGERELVVQPLDPRLGKVKDISAAALMEDGSPVLIVDVDDLVCSIEKRIASGTLSHRALRDADGERSAQKRKRVLAVDDSLTVRELERKLLESRGYLADVAVNGMDGWNAVRTGVYDLVITDVDMPRMDGIELTTLIKKDAHLKSLPVMIVSYKDREVDRLRGLEAGADYYLTKGSFHDERLLEAVVDLIGEPEV
jgi:two-component system, chemotaxis family, sensor histidine kinase and response regulator WspE